jgi:hypothetical protein
MSDDETRRELFDLLEAGIGSRGAAMLMSAIPPVGWNELATKNGLVGVRGEMAELRGEMAELRGELKGDMAGLRGDLKGDMAGLRGEMAELRAELKGEMAELRGEVRSMLPKLAATNIASMIGVAGLVLAAGAIA